MQCDGHFHVVDHHLVAVLGRAVGTARRWVCAGRLTQHALYHWLQSRVAHGRNAFASLGDVVVACENGGLNVDCVVALIMTADF